MTIRDVVLQKLDNNEPLTADEAIEWLEDRALYYERANNHAFRTERYRRQDDVHWKVAEVIRNLRKQGEP